MSYRGGPGRQRGNGRGGGRGRGNFNNRGGFGKNQYNDRYGGQRGKLVLVC